MGHKRDFNSTRQQRARLPKCGYCGKRSSILKFDEATNSRRHKRCFGKIPKQPKQPKTILEAYQTGVFKLDNYWRDELKLFREFRERNPDLSTERAATLYEYTRTQEELTNES